MMRGVRLIALFAVCTFLSCFVRSFVRSFVFFLYFARFCSVACCCFARAKSRFAARKEKVPSFVRSTFDDRSMFVRSTLSSFVALLPIRGFDSANEATTANDGKRRQATAASDGGKRRPATAASRLTYCGPYFQYDAPQLERFVGRICLGRTSELRQTDKRFG